MSPYRTGNRVGTSGGADSAKALRHDVGNQLAVHIGATSVDAVAAEGETLLIDA